MVFKDGQKDDSSLKKKLSCCVRNTPAGRLELLSLFFSHCLFSDLISQQERWEPWHSLSALGWMRSWEKSCGQHGWPGLADRLGAQSIRRLFVCFSTPLTSELAPLSANVSWATAGEETQEARRPTDSAKWEQGGITLAAFPPVQSTSDKSWMGIVYTYLSEFINWSSLTFLTIMCFFGNTRCELLRCRIQHT